MDVQGDQGWPVCHDARATKSLAGVDSRPQELTLQRADGQDISEKTDTLPKFPALMLISNEPIRWGRDLIEIKTSSLDSDDMMDRFLSQYGANINVYGPSDSVFDYQVIDKTVQYDESIPTFFIPPYTLFSHGHRLPASTMEHSTLDEKLC